MKDWTEKYRPKTLDDVIGNEKAINELRRWAESWKIGNPKKKAVILAGKPGTGKTSSALALANDFGWSVIELNTSDVRNANKIRSVVLSGATNETFSDDGSFLSSKTGGRKLIVLDEADNLYERAVGEDRTGDEFTDKGGKKAIVETIKVTNQPIILIVNDYYSLIKGGGESLKELCQLIRFYEPYPSEIVNLLKKICLLEDINVDQKVLQNIADRCKGDVRSAINDLQSIALGKKQVGTEALNALGYRDREKDIFSLLREIFKTKDFQAIRESMRHTDFDPNHILFWINENIPREYLDLEDLNRGYETLSRADIFLGRAFRIKNFDLWSYAYDFLGLGVSAAKSRVYPNSEYGFPTWLKERKAEHEVADVKDSIIKKISNVTHTSSNKVKDFILPNFITIFRNSTNFAIKMRDKLDLTEEEVKYLLGKTHAHKIKEIMLSKEKISEEKIDHMVSEESVEEKSKMQQTLLDF